MTVTKLELGVQHKVRVYIDEIFAFLLYSSDIKRYQLEENQEISQALYELIIKETVFRRAKQKAISILERMDRTEYEIRRKLMQSEYKEEIIERTIEWIKSYHYIDDKRYAENYVRYKKDQKSKKQIEMELYQKGVDKEIIYAVLEDGKRDDAQALKRAIEKKTKDIDALSFLEKQKLVAFLYRKGFCSEDIKKQLGNNAGKLFSDYK